MMVTFWCAHGFQDLPRISSLALIVTICPVATACGLTLKPTILVWYFQAWTAELTVPWKLSVK